MGGTCLKHSWRSPRCDPQPPASTPLSSATAPLLCRISCGNRGEQREPSMAQSCHTSHADDRGSEDTPTQGHTGSTSGLEAGGCSDFLVPVTTQRGATHEGSLSPTPTNDTSHTHTNHTYYTHPTHTHTHYIHTHTYAPHTTRTHTTHPFPRPACGRFSWHSLWSRGALAAPPTPPLTI